jgi:UDP-glucose 4-epimerase
MHILATGGAGYIGSHTLIELISDGHTVTVVDNLSNSNIEAVRRVERITNTTIPIYQVDATNREALDDVFNKQNIDAVIHFAGLKSVNESIVHPLKYYKNNIDSTLVLLEVMKKYRVEKLVFSSSATVYGTPEYLPLRESSRTGTGITNPYGQTKFMVEQILQDMSVADKSLQITILRYFNPVGAHASGLIGEDPNGIPNNLLPYISQVAIGRLEKVSIFGDDYDTTDGTGVRDYIHVVDLARGHVAALNKLQPGTEIYNLCTGMGVSVLQLIKAFSVASGKNIPYTIAPRRPGDIAACYATPEKANTNLGWYAEKTIEQACEDSWRWQSLNPSGYNQTI